MPPPPTSIREQLLAAIVATLTGAGIAASRCRLQPWTRAQATAKAVDVYPVSEKVTTDAGGDDMRELTVRCECAVLGSAATPIDQSLEVLLTSAIKAIMVEDTLGGLCRDITETSTQWNFEQAEDNIGVALLDFTVSYYTTRGDPTVNEN